MLMCEHDNWAHGITPGTEGTGLQCPIDPAKRDWVEERESSFGGAR